MSKQNGVVLQNGHSLPSSDQIKVELPSTKIENKGSQNRNGSVSTDVAGDMAEDDPWNAPELLDDSPKWSELTGQEKVLRVLKGFTKLALIIGLLYLFICSLDFLSASFRLIGGKGASQAMANSDLLKNPVAGLMIGVLVTVLVQSSSTSTSIIVSMVASNIITVEMSIPLIMGANIGTSITNTIVAMAQAGDRNEFRRAFAAATVLDMFNWLTVIVLLPIEVATKYLLWLTSHIARHVEHLGKSKNIELLVVLTKPFTKRIIQLDTTLLEETAAGLDVSGSLVQRWCQKNVTQVSYNETKSELFPNLTDCNQLRKQYANVISCQVVDSKVNATIEQERMMNVTVNLERCKHLFAKVELSDAVIGIILLVCSLFVLCVCLIFIVKILHTVMKGGTARMIKRIVNATFPKPFGFLTGYVAILVGTALTFLVQSSSIFTSTLTPLVGIGVITLERMYPLTLGANIGTTATAILAAMTASGRSLAPALQIAFCHLFFNISGILIWYPIPVLRRIPLNLSKKLGNITAKYRWFALVYLFGMFLALPALTFGISFGGWPAWVGVFGPLGLLLLFVVVVNVLQAKYPRVLPEKLQSWDFLPLWMRSLKPYDKPMTAMSNAVGKFKRKLCCGHKRKLAELKAETNLAMTKSTETL